MLIYGVYLTTIISIDKSTSIDRFKPVLTAGLVNTHTDRSFANLGYAWFCCSITSWEMKDNNGGVTKFVYKWHHLVCLIDISVVQSKIDRKVLSDYFQWSTAKILSFFLYVLTSIRVQYTNVKVVLVE